jgi:hypothetical protein|tara:strand:+ start:31 stop:267 length:237 start_codon:yes stop_codon:yes gene_type:complete
MSNALFLRLLDQLLGPYIADLSRDKLHGVGVWSGSIVLHNLALREEALDGRKKTLKPIRWDLLLHTATDPFCVLPFCV